MVGIIRVKAEVKNVFFLSENLGVRLKIFYGHIFLMKLFHCNLAKVFVD
jgi:hypothetical protein